ncbi:helix-turn-helix domain-containing protein (plasmid) [Nitrobacteraceae bacterium UC4446_H13]
MTDTASIGDAERQLSAALASRIREVRQLQKLSLDALARLAGLSKGTVVALENGNANPSIGVLCRLAAAFSLSVSDLLSDPADEASGRLIERTMSRTLWTSPKGSQAQLHASTSGQTMFELWCWTIAAGDEFRADGHSPDTCELIHVDKGTLTIRVGTESMTLNAGESARLVTDQPHSYAATTDEPAHFSMAVLERARS